jgi:hypothetical protein
MYDNKIYVKIPYSLKTEAKNLGALYDIEQKSWYINDNSLLHEKVYLNVTYDQRETVKQLGGIWCTDLKKWYTPKFNNKLINM